MPVYKWEGITRQGVIKKGEREAVNESAVVTWLRQQQVRPRSISEKKQGFQFALPGISGGVSHQEIVIFARQFATMIDAGLPLVQCLEILAGQQEGKTFKRILYEVKKEVEGGSTFADALKKHPKAFDELFVNLVAAGEVGGILDTIFMRLAAYLEKAMKLKKKVKSAMVYPVSIMIVASVVVSVLLVFVIPIFESMFKEFGNAELPAPTKIVIQISQGFKSNIIFIIIGVAAIIYAARRLYQHKKGRVWVDTMSLKLPVFGDLRHKSRQSCLTLHPWHQLLHQHQSFDTPLMETHHFPLMVQPWSYPH